jgi:branched-chain amino acid transport system ATP-binding protein
MLSVGVALMRSPRLYQLGEPSRGLAPECVEKVFGIIDAVHENYRTSILLLEQNLTEALSIAHQVYVLAGGHLTFSGNPAQFKQVEKVSKIFWGDTKESKDLSSLAGGETW